MKKLLFDLKEIEKKGRSLYLKGFLLTRSDKQTKIVFYCTECKKRVESCIATFISKFEERDFKCSTCLTEDTCMKKYGVKNGGGSKLAIEKIKKNRVLPKDFGKRMSEITKKIWDMRNPEERKIIASKMRDYKNSLTKEEKTIIENKRKSTMKVRYGVESPGQVYKFSSRAKRSVSIQKYTTKLGNCVLYQGSYELGFIKACESLGIEVKNGPRIIYSINGKRFNYYVDFEIDKYILEVKGNHHWYKRDLENGKISAKNKSAKRWANKNEKNYLFLFGNIDYRLLLKEMGY